MKKSIVITSALLISVTIPLTTFAKTTSCKIPSTNQVEQLFEDWNNALKTRDTQKIISLYANNGVLLPTLSNTPRTNHKQLKDYFITFVKNHPSSELDSYVIRSGCNWATNTGLYTFTFFSDYPKGKEMVTARFTYSYEYIHGKWLITSHHSSLLPNSKTPTEDKKEMQELES